VYVCILVYSVCIVYMYGVCMCTCIQCMYSVCVVYVQCTHV